MIQPWPALSINGSNSVRCSLASFYQSEMRKPGIEKFVSRGLIVDESSLNLRKPMVTP